MLRCYSPADLALLLGGTGLEIRFADLPREAHSYLAVLRHAEEPC